MPDRFRVEGVVIGEGSVVSMGVFIGASNELGEFRAGTMAHAIGPAAIGAVPAVVIGGVGAVVVAGAWAWLFPTLRNARRLDGKDVEHPA